MRRAGTALSLVFPAAQAVGELRRYDGEPAGWTRLAPARGTVKVAPGVPLGLWLHNRRRIDLSFLDGLPVEPFTTLRLGGAMLTPADYRRVARFAWLRELDLDGSGTENADLAALRPLVNLAELRVGGSLVDARGLLTLDAPLLRRLDLDHSNVGGGLGALARMPRLESLDLSSTAVADDSIAGLAALRALTRVDLSHTDLSPAGCAAVGRLPLLEDVLLGGLPVDASATRELAALPGLVTLDVASCELEDDDVVPLALAGRLARLRLSSNPVGDVGAAWLEGVPTLESIWADDTEIGDAGVARLAGLPLLRELVLDGTAVTAAGIAALAGHDRLHRLDLARTAAGDDALAVLPSLPRLAELDLGATPVTDAGIAYLARCRNLRSLRVGGTNVTRHGLWRLVDALPDLELPDLGLAVAPADRPVTNTQAPVTGNATASGGES